MNLGARARALRLALVLLLIDVGGARVLHWLDAGDKMFSGGLSGALLAAIVFGFLALRVMLTFIVPGYVAGVVVQSWLHERGRSK